MITANKIYKIKLKNGEEITGQMVGAKIHSKIFRDQSGKRIEIQNSDIESFEMIEDLTNKPYKHQDRDHKLKNKKGGHMSMKSAYQTGEW